MPHTHRRPRGPHEYAPPRYTVYAVCAAAGTVAVGLIIGLIVTADDAEAAPPIPAVRLCTPASGGGIQCVDGDTARADRDAIDQDAAEYHGARLGRIVGAARFDAMLAATP